MSLRSSVFHPDHDQERRCQITGRMTPVHARTGTAIRRPDLPVRWAGAALHERGRRVAAVSLIRVQNIRGRVLLLADEGDRPRIWKSL
jgi:hypothetical protein